MPALLEMLGIPSTGSDAAVVVLTLDKGLAKIFAAAKGIRTAPYVLVRTDQSLGPLDLRYPLFAKPVAEGSSMGIDVGSICRDERTLRARVAKLQHDYRQPVLIEEYLPGDEFTVGVVGNGDTAEVLAVSQLLARDHEGDWVYSLEMKRNSVEQVRYVMTDELLRTGRLTPAELDEMHDLALQVHRTFGCRDVSRVDIRYDRDGLLNFIEVNPLPGLTPNISDLVVMARSHGCSYDQLISRILAAAIDRWDRRAASY